MRTRLKYTKHEDTYYTTPVVCREGILVYTVMISSLSLFIVDKIRGNVIDVFRAESLQQAKKMIKLDAVERGAKFNDEIRKRK